MDESKARGTFSLICHARRRYGQDVILADLTADQLALVHTDRDAAVAELVQKGVAARRLQHAKRLRERADQLEALALAGAS
ncbi:hypothetical protein VT930_16910 [Mycobacterium sherrisii]|uniref:hypothetical protein n=1 Tax=Mycobacterium sherrisii TaxID=243061 RepID=UPI002DDDB371|nr:hypothetical protein [Mycobacterium sherrisii]MEC4764773.1 hypothetical protein [Mycobacterium sherrisii]